MVYKSDQESALKAYIDAALTQVGGTGTTDDDLVMQAIPEQCSG